MNNSFVLTSVILVSMLTFSAARAADVCRSYLACGTYSRSGDERDGEAAATFQLMIKAVGEDKAILEFSRIEAGQRVSAEFLLRFQADSSFKASVDGKTYVTGYCGNSACTYAFAPPAREVPAASSGTIRFFRDSLELSQFIVDETGQRKVSKVFRKE